MKKFLYIALSLLTVAGWQLPSAAQDISKPRVFFSITYLNNARDKDGNKLPYYQSFIYAAETWEHEVKEKYSFDPNKDKFIEAHVRTANDFVIVWKHIYQTSLNDDDTVVEGAIFSHSSVPFSTHDPHIVWETGLEFAEEPGIKRTGGTLTQKIIDDLPKLNWGKSGSLNLFGCNTAVTRGFPTWCPAEEFADTQNVKTTGEVGFSYFSLLKDKYVG